MNYRLFLILSFLMILSFRVSAQRDSLKLNDIVNRLMASGKSDETIKEIMNGVIKDPGLYDGLWNEFIQQVDDSSKWALIPDLNVDFKTFQNVDSTATSLGFSYDFGFDYAKFQEKGKQRISKSFGIKARGNVAFNSGVNPTDFLETKFFGSHAHFIGGVIQQTDSAYFSKLNEIEDKLVFMDDLNSEKARALWNEFGEYMSLGNQYYFSVNPQFGLESDQRFSKTQFTPGLQLGFGAKAWNTSSALSYFNLLDYPFALLRRISGTDKRWTIYGASLPTLQVGFDYVIPTQDTIREQLLGNLSPFPRLRLESGFKTFVTRVAKENIFFSANFRYYKELGSSAEIRLANLDEHTYLVMALQSTTGFYVSFATGKLPFDSINDEVYALGFNYKF